MNIRAVLFWVVTPCSDMAGYHTYHCDVSISDDEPLWGRNASQGPPIGKSANQESHFHTGVQ
jgi:hypothetical protein